MASYPIYWCQHPDRQAPNQLASTVAAMHCRRGLFRWLSLIALISGCASTDPGVIASSTRTVKAPTEGVIRVDPNVRIVTLVNGLTVYLRNNDRPGNSVEMRLVINAGSGQQDQDQAGAAHFLEHMMFNGTRQFPENDMIATLRGFGMQFGADVNAYTSYDETVYSLSVPTDAPGNVGTGLDILHEWLSEATLDPAQVTSEKGVVLDEWRQRDQSLDGRSEKALESDLLDGSEYEGRQPIGDDTAINAMTPDLLRRFYDTWYRPDNAAVIVVGDIDIDDIEAEIRAQFGALSPRGESPVRADPQLAATNQPVVTVVLDPDATTGAVDIALPTLQPQPDSIDGLRAGELTALAFNMIAQRLDDDILRGDADFTSAGSRDEGPVRRLDAPSVSVVAEPAKLAGAIDALTLEFERARRFGFDAGELDRALRSFRGALQAEVDGSDTVQDADYADRYVGHFLAGTPIPSAGTSFQIYDQMYSDITTEEVRLALNDLLTWSAPHVLVLAPDSMTDPPTKEMVLARLGALPSIDVVARPPTSLATTELMTPPDPVEETDSEALDTDGSFVSPTMLTFANGARVVLNPTDIADNEVYFGATSPGGLSLVADADLAEALTAVSVVSASGVGDLDAVGLDTVLADAAISMQPSIGQTSEDFAGSSTTDDLELLFQLFNLYLDEPRFEQTALDSTIKSLRQYVDQPNSDPDLAGYIAYSEARYGSEPRYQVIPTADDLAALDLATIERVWRGRFGNASDWVLAISGDFDIDQATDLARRYVGTLAGTNTTEQFKDFQQAAPRTIVTKDVKAGTGDKGSLTLVWNESAVVDSTTTEVAAGVLTSILNIRLTDHIREELGASYSPSASVSVEFAPDQLIQTYMNVTGDPEKIPQTSAIVIADVAALRANGPTAAEFDAALAEVGKSYQLFDNQTIGNLLLEAALSPQAIDRFGIRFTTLSALTTTTLKVFINQVLPLDRYIEIRTVPS